MQNGDVAKAEVFLKNRMAMHNKVNSKSIIDEARAQVRHDKIG